MTSNDKIEVADRVPDRIGPIAREASSAIPTSFDRSAIAPSAVEPPSVLSAGATPEPVESVTGPGWIASMASIIPASWLLGTAILAMRLLVGHRRMARLRGTAIPADAEAAQAGRAPAAPAGTGGDRDDLAAFAAGAAERLHHRASAREFRRTDWRLRPPLPRLRVGPAS